MFSKIQNITLSNIDNLIINRISPIETTLGLIKDEVEFAEASKIWAAAFSQGSMAAFGIQDKTPQEAATVLRKKFGEPSLTHKNVTAWLFQTDTQPPISILFDCGFFSTVRLSIIAPSFPDSIDALTNLRDAKRIKTSPQFKEHPHKPIQSKYGTANPRPV
jgi:hypothetical protein